MKMKEHTSKIDGTPSSRSEVAFPRRLTNGARARGHVVGHGTGEPAPASLDGRPRGHVVGHGTGEPAPASLDGRPRGHIVGHAPSRSRGR